MFSDITRRTPESLLLRRYVGCVAVERPLPIGDVVALLMFESAAI